MDRRPRLIIVYGHRSLDAMQLREAARGWCDLIWLIDPEDASAAAVAPLLRRSGPVVEALGLPADEAAAALAPHEPDGLVTFHDTGMKHIAAIAAQLALPFNGTETALALEDKYHQRAAFRAAGLPTPSVVVLPVGADQATICELLEQVTYPAVLKPRRASGSWHTFRVDSAGELAAHLLELADEPPEERIVEGYLDDGPGMPNGFEADYVSVESVVVDGKILHLGATGRWPLVAPMRETGFFMPSTLGEEALRAVLDVAGEALQALDIRVGCAHTEIKLTANGPQVIEVNGRIGGGVQEMLKLSTGVDMVVLAMRAALGLDLKVDAMPEPSGVAYRFFYQPPTSARRLIAITGLDDVSEHPGVESLFLHHAPGTELDASHGTRTYLFAVLGHTHDHAGVVEAYEHMTRSVKAVYEQTPGTAGPLPYAPEHASLQQSAAPVAG